MTDYQAFLKMIHDLPHTVRSARQRRNLTQYDAATEIGVHHSMLCRIEKGCGINVRTLTKVLDWLHYSSNWGKS